MSANLLYEQLFALLRLALHGQQPDEVMLASVDWGKLLELSGRQGVLSIIYDGVKLLPKELQPPKNILLRFVVNVDRDEKNYHHIVKTTSKLVAFYARHGIKMLLFKGLSVSQYYPEPSHRPFGDIDIWLFGKGVEADELVRQEFGVDVEVDMFDHHATFVLDGILVENHIDFIDTYLHKSTRRIDEVLHEFARQSSRTFRCADVDVIEPSSSFNALFLIYHAAKHFARTSENIGVRQLLDWAYFLKNNHQDVEWSSIYELYEDAGCHRFTDVVNAIIVSRLGFDKSIVPNMVREEELEERVLTEMLLRNDPSNVEPNGFWSGFVFKCRRFWRNRWKHKIVFDESMLGFATRSAWAHVRQLFSFSRKR